MVKALIIDLAGRGSNKGAHAYHAAPQNASDREFFQGCTTCLARIGTDSLGHSSGSVRRSSSYPEPQPGRTILQVSHGLVVELAGVSGEPGL